MYKRLKIAYKKVYSFLFGQEDEHIHTREEQKKYYGRIRSETNTETRMIHQYPKEGKFRFPLIADDISTPRGKSQIVQANNKSTEQVSRQPNVTPLVKQKPQTKTSSEKPEVTPGKERKKFQGVNFKATVIPSPIYAFGKPPGGGEAQFEDEVVTIQQEQEKELIHEVYQPRVEIPIVEDLTPTVTETFVMTPTLVVDTFEDEVETYSSNDVTTEEVLVENADEAHQDDCLNPTVYDENQEEIYVNNNDNNEIIQNTNEEELVEDDHSSMEAQNLDQVFVENTLSTMDDTQEELCQQPSYREAVATVEEEIDTEVSKSSEELEHMSSLVNIDNRVVSNEEKEVPRKTVVPFNVLMFHKDRLAQKRTEAKLENTYQFPTLQLLNIPSRQPDNSNMWLDEKRETLEDTLANFNVQAKVVGVTRGPSVTRFEIQPEPGVKVSKVTGLQDDIKLSLAAKDIRMEAPIPGKNAIGIEVPNDVSDPVVIREILRSSEFQKNPSPLTVALGLDIEGKPIVTDIQKMPHGLIAGATGSGKSVCINSILVSIMFKATPDEVKLMLVDPKMVELAPYNDIPHLVTPVITDAKQATIALKWAVEEMERRYELFVQNGVRDIKRYNEVMSNGEDAPPAMPYIVIVIDELADLMMVSPHDVEEAICRIAQKARACGIHLLLATQRPSVDVITGLIKANIPTRIAFSVSSQADSRTIIDSGGAERLLGKGDMLLFENGSSKPVRVQGNYVSDEEIDRVVALVKDQRKPNYLFDKDSLIKSYETSGDQEDDLFEEACYYVMEQGGASSSSLQRRFRIGFNRAARLIDMMEARGIISEAMGSKPRNVLISEEELSDRM